MTLSKGQLSELRDLVDALCEDMLTREQAAQLEALVCTDDEACRYYLNYLNLHGLLLLENTSGEPLDARWMVRQATQAAPAPPPPGRSPLLGFLSSSLQPGLDYVSHRMPLLTIAAALAMGSLVTMLVAWVVVPYWRGAPTPVPDRVLVQAPVQAPVQPPVPVPVQAPVQVPVQPPVLKHVARLMRTVGCKWADGAAPTPGAFLAREQRLELVEGLAEIVFHSGARVVLQGPSTFELESGNAGRLDVGRLVGKVCPDAVGFAVQTPVARIVDLGTEFGVLVEETGPIEVHCFVGAVEVEKHIPGEAVPKAYRTERLCGGEARRMDAAGAEVIKPDSRQFVRKLPSEHPGPLVKDAEVSWGTGEYAVRCNHNGGAAPYVTVNADRYQVAGTNTYVDRQVHIFIRFDVANLSADEVLAARLSLLSYHPYNWATPGNVRIGLYKVTQSWVEGAKTGQQGEQGDVTYNNQPSHDPTPVATVTVPSTITEFQGASGGVWHVWDSKAPGNAGLADLLREWAAGTTPNHGLMIRFIRPGDATLRPYHRYRSSEHTVLSQRPKLEIDTHGGSFLLGQEEQQQEQTGGAGGWKGTKLEGVW
jgi:hypothetical protein